MSSAELRSVDAQSAAHEVAGGAVLLDVREDDEWLAGHAPQARHMPLGQLEDRFAELNREGAYVVVCRSGSRSQRAQGLLTQHGLAVANLDGGMRAWSDAGLPVVKDEGAPGTVI